MHARSTDSPVVMDDLSQERIPLEVGLGEFVATLSTRDIPVGVRESAEQHIVDTIAVAVGAVPSRLGRTLVAAARAQEGSGGCHVVGLSSGQSPAEAAWYNAAFAHALDFDDTGFTHASAVIVPAALAVAETVSADWSAVVDAVIVGYEVGASVSRTLGEYEVTMRKRGVHPTSVLGAPAAAAAGARLLGLDARGTAHAIALASATTFGSTRQFGTWAKSLNAAIAARSGVSAALLVANGFTGAIDAMTGNRGALAAFVGEQAVGIATSFPRTRTGTWAIENPGLYLKKYPACTLTLASIDAAIAMMVEADASPDQVRRIRVDAHPYVFEALRYDRPRSGMEGKFSLRWALAAAVGFGAGIASFEDEALESTEFRRLMDAVEIVSHSEWSDDRRHYTRVRIDLESQSGPVSLDRECVEAVRMSDDDARAKAVECLRLGGGQIVADALMSGRRVIGSDDLTKDLAWLGDEVAKHSAVMIRAGGTAGSE